MLAQLFLSFVFRLSFPPSQKERLDSRKEFGGFKM